jgi:hypothetical protein
MNAQLLRLKGQSHPIAAGLQVRRLLPAAAQHSMSPFVFFDHFSPTLGWQR